MSLERYQVTEVPTGEVFCDHNFNCRGRINATQCEDLAKSIDDRGLEFPIHVQPYTEKAPYKYRIISGHRRFTACLMLKLPVVPVVIRNDIVDEDAARDSNLIENIQRSDLGLLAESRAIEYYVKKGYSNNAIARRLGKSVGWVETRYRVNMLPDFVQDEVAKETINQGHVNTLWNYRDDPEKLSELIRQIKERKEAGEKAIHIKEKMTVQEFATARRPKPHEVAHFSEVLGNMVTFRVIEDGEDEYFPARLLCWMRGEISLAQLYVSLRKECYRLDYKFDPPPDIKAIFDGIAKV